MPFDIDQFIDEPSVEVLYEADLKKDDWFRLASNYNISVKSAWKKALIKNTVLEALVNQNVLESRALDLCEPVASVDSLRMLELQLEREKLRDREKEREDREKEREEREREREFQLVLLERKAQLSTSEKVREFDVAKVSKFTPQFNENDPEEFFIQFENVAKTLSWPEQYWPLLVQSVLKGKGLSTYLSLQSTHQSDYSIVKESILKAYQLTAEFYKVKFRNSFKEPNQTYFEYAHYLTRLRNRWLSSSGITTFDQLCELIVMEQYLKGVPQEIKLYLCEKEVTSLDRAASLAENYSLICRTRRKGFEKHATVQVESPPWNGKLIGGQTSQSNKSSVLGSSSFHVKGGYGKFNTCHYCKKPGHYISKCPKLEKRNQVKFDPKPIANCVFNPTDSCDLLCSKVVPEVKDPQELFQPFRFGGFVSVNKDSTPVPVSILRDTGASHSVVVRDSVPFIDEVYTGESVVLRGVGGSTTVPLARLYLETDLISQPVTVAVQDSLPVNGVTFLLGNDVAGSRVVPDPIVCPSPLDTDPAAEVEKTVPGLFPACAVTRSRARSIAELGDVGDAVEDNLEDGGLSMLFSDPDMLDEERVQVTPDRISNSDYEGSQRVEGIPGALSESQDLSNLKVTRQMLIDAQKLDTTLNTLFHNVVTESESEGEPLCYYIQSGVLMRKFRPPDVPTNEPWHVLKQIVIPSCYRNMVISLAHDHIGGHLGVRKTADKVLRYFFWPGIKSDISQYCKSCSTCQIAGKPNQVIPPAPLKPIPAVNEPFSRVIIDCVGPLPKTRSGNQFLLTLMCNSTRYPEAVPLRRITTRTIIPVLLKFFTQFGLPNVIQSDQGSNFTSNIFKQVMTILGIKQHLSSAYHPESQGALERWHQTIKSMLTKYCIETNKDWDEGIPLILYAIRSTRQESLGYSPNEMLFGRDVRGPLKLLQESWMDGEETMRLSEYVMKMREKLKHVHEFARLNLSKSQEKMKAHYDEKSQVRVFKEGDRVLLFLPVRKYPLQARYQGPFEVLKKESNLNYVIATPGRRKNKRLVHVNLLKEYNERKDDKVESEIVNINVKFKNEPDGIEENDFEVNMDVKLKNSDVLCHLESKLGHLEGKQRLELCTLLYNYVDICSDVPQPSPVVEHDIVLMDNAAPVRQAPYRVSPEKRKVLKDEVEFLMKYDLVETSKSEWAAPCVLVPKRDGSMRMCTDYRRVNALTRADSYPLPRIDDIIDSVGTASFMTKIDMLRGYYQVPLTERAKTISAFITPDGLFQYKVMPFGLRNAPGTFQRLTSGLISGLEGVQCYIDDLIVYSNSWKAHIETLCTLFQRLREASLTINLVKSDFGHATLQFLGHEVGCGKVAPISAKVEAICDMPAPRTRKDVQRFLGMAGYYRRFCPNFAEVVSPLTDLVSPKRPMVWNERCQEAFDKVKSILMCNTVLKGPNFDQAFVLHIDASDVAAGAVLMQEGEGGILYPVSYMSTKFKPHQKNYSTIEKEALSLLIALEKFDVYLGSTGNKIIVYSDHNPLTFVSRMKNKNQRLTRWCLALQPYNLEIRHIKGRENVIADLLSRPPV